MIIQSTRVYYASTFNEAQIEVENGIITNILPYNTKPVDYDYQNLRIVPGFVDVHTHGAYGFDTNDADYEGLKMWKQRILEEGVTSFCPTTITQSNEVLTNAVKNIAKLYKQNEKGADIVGIHFEGPYLDQKFKGAQPSEHIKKPDLEEFKEYLKASDNLIKIVTLATEHDDDFKLTRYLRSHDIVASIGHSGASIEEARMAVANGARSMTHIYNGMSRFNHRENNLVGAAMVFNDVYGEVICDGNHSSISALKMLFKAKDNNYLIMITDALKCKGFKVGSKFIFGGNEVEMYPDGSAHLTATKNLAGSTLKVNEGLKLLVEKVEIPFEQAIKTCTINPATMLGLNNKIGKIQISMDADLVVLADDYQVKASICKGIVNEF